MIDKAIFLLFLRQHITKMKKRFTFLSLLFVTLWLIYIFQKPLFMLYNGALSMSASLTLKDFLQVMQHGASMDAAMVGYIIGLPFICVLISIWYKRFPLKKILIPYYIIAALLITITFVVDMVLYSFWEFKLDATIFVYIDSPKNAAASVSLGFILIRLFLILLLTAFNYKLMSMVTPKMLEKTKHRFMGTIGMLLIAGILVLIIRGGVGRSTTNVGQAYYCENQFLNHSAVNPTFSLLASMSKSKDYSKQFNFFDEGKRADLFNGLYYTSDGDSVPKLLKTKTPNVLILLLEGYGAQFIGTLGGYKDIAPNLNKFSEEGIFFTNCYADSYRTDRGMVCAFSGYLGLPTVSLTKLPTKCSKLPSIAKELEQKGYSTDFIYGGDIDFANMKGYLKSTGFQHLTSAGNFSLKEQTSNAWGVNDEYTFNYLYNELKNRKPGLWHTAFLTLSSHEPFEVPFNKFEDKVKNAYAYTDDCIGKFIHQLKASPLWDNLLVVIVPDHGRHYPANEYPNGPKFFRIPMIWVGGAVKQPVKVDKIMNQSDLSATLLGQLGIDHSKFTFSRNILSSEYKYPFAFYSYNNGFAFTDSTGITLFDNNANEVIINQPSANENRLNRGKAILQSVFDHLAGI